MNTAGLSDVVEILMDEPAVAADGRSFRDLDVHHALKRMGVTHLADGGGWSGLRRHSERKSNPRTNSVYAGETFTRVRDKRFQP